MEGEGGAGGDDDDDDDASDDDEPLRAHTTLSVEAAARTVLEEIDALRRRVRHSRGIIAGGFYVKTKKAPRETTRMIEECVEAPCRRNVVAPPGVWRCDVVSVSWTVGVTIKLGARVPRSETRMLRAMLADADGAMLAVAAAAGRCGGPPPPGWAGAPPCAFGGPPRELPPPMTVTDVSRNSLTGQARRCVADCAGLVFTPFCLVRAPCVRWAADVKTKK